MTTSTAACPRLKVVVSLAGHIDHGKSSLVRALTGSVVDRLPEEQRRGMTIDLGFAHFDAGGVRFALIDVPGHERFIHTMVAGASGVDLALLVVAADDSVMTQTREHLAVLELLGVRHGVVAITKCDLVDAEQLELVRLEIAELLEPTSLFQARVIEVSTRTGQGIDELRDAIIACARELPARPQSDSAFRLPVDRVFSPAGQGTVVTGTVRSGTARVGDVLHLLPEETEVRIRRLQSHGVDVERITVGERAAINLAGVKASAIDRGNELATPGAFEPARRHLVQLRTLPDSSTDLKHRGLVRWHLGAEQVTVQVLMEPRAVPPGGTAFAVLRASKNVVTEYGEPFVLRQLSPARTIGGGTIIGPALRPSERLNRCLQAAQGLSSQAPETRLAAYVDLHREVEPDRDVGTQLGLNSSDFRSACQQLVKQKIVVRAGSEHPRLLTASRFSQLQQQMIAQCQAEVERRRPAWQVPIAPVLAAMSRQASLPVLNAVLEGLVSRGELVRLGDRIGRPAGAELSRRQRSLLDALLAECNSTGRMPPTLKEFAEDNGCTVRDLEPLVQLAIDQGRLERLSPEIVMSPAVLEELRIKLVDYFERHPTARVSEVREHWGITRKHAVPIFEFFDRHQITVRDGDVRTAGPRLKLSLGEASA